MADENEKIRGAGFLEGETIRLSAPREEDFPEWSSWLNNSQITRYLGQGFFPYSVEKQKRWAQDESEAGRMLLMVREKKSDQLLGVVSLASIDWVARTAGVAAVVPNKHSRAKYAALESRALLMQHAFETLGLRRLTSGQVFPGNIRWTIFQMIIGWVPESFAFNAFKKGNFESDVINLASSNDIFASLVSQREGQLWPGRKEVERLRREVDEGDVRRALFELRDVNLTFIEQSVRALGIAGIREAYTGSVVTSRETTRQAKTDAIL